MSDSSSPAGARFDVIYDGDCGICEACRELCGRLDWLGLFAWRRNQDPAVLRDHPGLAQGDLDAAMHLVGGGKALSGFDAVRFILLRMPLTSWLGALMFLPGASIPGNFAYKWVAAHRKTTLACRLGEPTIVHRALANVFICAVLAVVAAGTLLRREDWPLSCVPMFANHVEPDGARYSFRFVAIDGKGKEKEIPADASGVPELRLKRVFFARSYGSSDPDYEYGAIPGDTPEAFEKRMTEFFRIFTAEAREREALPPSTEAIRLDVVREGSKSEKQVVGRYAIGGEFRRPR